MLGTIIETLEDNFTPAQVLQIRKEAHRAGQRVNIKRLYSQRVRVEIIQPNRTIEARYSVKRVN